MRGPCCLPVLLAPGALAGCVETGDFSRRLSEDAAAGAVLVRAVRGRGRAGSRRRSHPTRRARQDGRGRDGRGRATARVGENRCLIAWVTAASAFRLSARRYALTDLVIQGPQTDAGPTKRAIDRLASERTQLDGLGLPPLAALACSGDRSGRSVGHTSQPSRPAVLIGKG